MPTTRPLFLLAIVTLIAGLAACANTIRGVGRDAQQTGQAIEDTVEGDP